MAYTNISSEDAFLFLRKWCDESPAIVLHVTYGDPPLPVVLAVKGRIRYLTNKLFEVVTESNALVVIKYADCTQLFLDDRGEAVAPEHVNITEIEAEIGVMKQGITIQIQHSSGLLMIINELQISGSG